MNIKSLRLFRNVVATGSLSEAAARMNLSPSAASRLLTQLETSLKLELFSRSRRNLELTEAGAMFYQQISNTLDGIDEIPVIARDLRTRTRNWLSVVTAAPLANGLVVPTIARLRREGVDLQCTLHVESRFQIESKVAARGYNMGMISLPVQNEIIPIDIMPVLRSRLCALMPADHPLSAETEIGVEALAAEPLVTLAAGQLWRDRLEELMGKAGLRPEIAFETGSTLVTVEMVRHGLGLTLIDPMVMTSTMLQGLAIRPLAGDAWITYASVHAPGPRAELAEVFLDGLCAHVEARRTTEPGLADLIYLI
ncbi:LysR family transcriptional regulator [Pseudooceanicola sp. 216_PA32_1]|uniref:LysR family transcriptional regulator n=1 Tax=Pseudooceanicola pacificus TaxID=2676438 RepID=A0A844WC02_9RHOB|nr:LysR family transcriptional regulator [Pseudooceanicola pacificus]MWB78793.1 LysR family transcriptional regulator [Pseudooceanicola pacificus]